MKTQTTIIKSILLVNAVTGFNRSIAESLNNLEISVEPVINGTQALRKLENTTFDCLMLDTNLTDIKSFEIVERAKTLYPEMIVIMTSDKPSYAILIEAMRMGVDNFLISPFDFEQLMETLSFYNY